MKTIHTITAESFKPYGVVLEFSPHPEDDRFEILVEEKNAPWRLAVFCVRSHEAAQLECHPTSLETFEPMQGTGILLVARPDAPQNWQAFLLDRPVCLAKGVWHEVIAVSQQATYKITENLEVCSEFYRLPKPAAAWVE